MGLRDSNYELVQHLGNGAFGVVELWRKKHGLAELVVAKRVYIGDLSNADDAKARQEASLLKDMNHPSIVKYLGSWVNRPTEELIILQTYYEGGDLAATIAQARQHLRYLSGDIVTRWLAQVTHALHYCHQKVKMLHRDLKPSNIFLSVCQDHAYLGDFGVAKMLGSADSFCHTVIGTQRYMSPEVHRGQRYGLRSDVWALGVVLYELLTLRLPFDARDPLTLLKAITSDTLPDPWPQGRDLPLGLEALCFEMLTKDVHDRPTLSELLAANSLLREAVSKYEAEVCWDTTDSFVPDTTEVLQFRGDEDAQLVHMGHDGIDFQEATLEAWPPPIPADGEATVAEVAAAVVGTPIEAADGLAAGRLLEAAVDIERRLLEGRLVQDSGHAVSVTAGSANCNDGVIACVRYPDGGDAEGEVPPIESIDAAPCDSHFDAQAVDAALDAEDLGTAVRRAAEVQDLSGLTRHKSKLHEVLVLAGAAGPPTLHDLLEEQEHRAAEDAEQAVEGCELHHLATASARGLLEAPASLRSIPSTSGVGCSVGNEGGVCGSEATGSLMSRNTRNIPGPRLPKISVGAHGAVGAPVPLGGSIFQPARGSGWRRQVKTISTRLQCVDVLKSRAPDPVQLKATLGHLRALEMECEPCGQAIRCHAQRLTLCAQDAVTRGGAVLPAVERAAELLEAVRHEVDDVSAPALHALEHASRHLHHVRAASSQVGLRITCGAFVRLVTVPQSASFVDVFTVVARRWGQPTAPSAFTLVWHHEDFSRALRDDCVWRECVDTVPAGASIELEMRLPSRPRKGRPFARNSLAGLAASTHTPARNTRPPTGPSGPEIAGKRAGPPGLSKWSAT